MEYPAAHSTSGQPETSPDPAYTSAQQSAYSEQHEPTTSFSAATAFVSGSRKRYQCTQCDKMFTTTGHLSRHSKTHSGDKPFVCPYPGCDKKTARHDNLVQHFRIHLPKADRKRGASYIRDIIQLMETTDCPGTTVLQIAGLIPMGPTSSAAPSTQSMREEPTGEEDEEAEDEYARTGSPAVPLPEPTSRQHRTPPRGVKLDAASARGLDVIKTEPSADPSVGFLDSSLAYHDNGALHPAAGPPALQAGLDHMPPWRIPRQRSFPIVKRDDSSADTLQ